MFTLTVRGSTLDVRIWRLQTSDSDDWCRSPGCKGWQGDWCKYENAASEGKYWDTDIKWYFRNIACAFTCGGESGHVKNGSIKLPCLGGSSLKHVQSSFVWPWHLCLPSWHSLHYVSLSHKETPREHVILIDRVRKVSMCWPNDASLSTCSSFLFMCAPYELNDKMPCFLHLSGFNWILHRTATTIYIHPSFMYSIYRYMYKLSQDGICIRGEERGFSICVMICCVFVHPLSCRCIRHCLIYIISKICWYWLIRHTKMTFQQL